MSVLGADPAEARRRLAEPGRRHAASVRAWAGLTVQESMRLHAYHRAPRDVEQTIGLVGLADKADTVGARLSGGQRRRLDFARRAGTWPVPGAAVGQLRREGPVGGGTAAVEQDAAVQRQGDHVVQAHVGRI